MRGTRYSAQDEDLLEEKEINKGMRWGAAHVIIFL